MVLRSATSLLGALEGEGPRNDVALLKTITYRVIKTTGTLIVISLRLVTVCWLYLSFMIWGVHVDL
jgi:hypothetical protein